jgi:hypothetical protein
MVQVISRPAKSFAWSFSRVSNFMTCPKKYFHTQVAKDVVETYEHRGHGDEVHKMMEERLTKARPLPAAYAHWERWPAEILSDVDRTVVTLAAERELGITADFKPCEYFDRTVPVWSRAKIDVLKVYPDGRAYIADWKTGKIKEDNDQLLLMALFTMIHYPRVKTVDAEFIFLKEDTGPDVPRNNCVYAVRVTEDDVMEFWQRYKQYVKRLQSAHETLEFPAQESGLCKRYCPVKSCRFNGSYGK